jgi:DNA-binding transcriptional LysR family regulator
MELRQLQYLVAVVDEASFTGAAKRTHVAQPAISRQVAQLEIELGQKLLERTRGRVEPTPAGAMFLPYARAALTALADGRAAVAELSQSLSGKLWLGSVQAPPPAAIASLAGFTTRHPHVEVKLRIDHTDRLVTDLAARRLDAAVLASGQATVPDEFDSIALGSEPLVVVVERSHPLARRRSLPLEALRDQSIVTLPHGSGLRTLLEATCTAAGFAPRIETETDDVTLLAQLAEHGLGIALLPRSLAEDAGQQVAILRLREPELRRHLFVAAPAEGASANGRAFFRHVQSYLAAT